MRGRLSAGLLLLRATGVAALALLLWNPVTTRSEPGGPPLVLLDASLSMAGQGGPWRAALDTARALAADGVIWRFGRAVRAFDPLPPADGASRLGPALTAAAARVGPVIVVTDGAIADLPDVPLRVSYGISGMRDALKDSLTVAGSEMRDANLTLSVEGRRLVSRHVALPDSGIVSTELTFPVSRFPSGWSAVEVRLEGAGDDEPRDDARLFVVDVSPAPAIVMLAAPPDWDTRFLSRTLAEVARVPVKTFVATEPGRWRDAATLAPVSPADLARSAAAARLVVAAGDPTLLPTPGLRRAAPPSLLSWPTVGGVPGDWYVEPPPPSPVAAALAGIPWDSVPPATAATGVAPGRDTSGEVALSARLARRGAPRPIVRLGVRDGVRQATLSATGLYRWVFRGGAGAEAYRALVAALADWLLGGGEGRGERFVPVTYEVPNGTPVVWRWVGRGVTGSPSDIVLRLAGNASERVDTLRFDAAGQAELLLPPGVYRYASEDGGGGGERGLVAVETYSDEWRPAQAVLRAHEGAPAGRLVGIGLRDRWWLYVVAIATFAAEWAWRRRQGLP